MWRSLMFCLALWSLVSCANSQSQVTRSNIMFIVDGMGPAHITGARIFKGGVEARLEMEKMPYTGIVRTHSSDGFVTDSAASATALASGARTYNEAVGVTDSKVDPSGESQPLKTILDRAKEAGKSVGLVTTARITHATPAAFYAKVPHRDLEEEIAAQLPDSEIDLIIGGGRAFFLPEGSGGLRKDGKNLIESMKAQGYQVVTSNGEFQKLNPNSNQRIVALLEDDHLPYDLDRKSEPALEELVDFAIQYLSQNPKGYFLMVEAGRVDHASHENVARHAFGDLLALDRALKRSFPEADKGTLIVLTADHETGGLAISGYAPKEYVHGDTLLRNYVRNPENSMQTHGFVSWATGPGFDSPYKVDEKQKNAKHKATYSSRSAYHTAVDVPVMAMGPGASEFTGFLDNKEIVHKVIELMDLEPLKK